MPSVRYLKRWKIRALDKILYCSFFSSTLHLCHSDDPKYDEFINYYRQHIFLSRCFFLSVVFELPSLLLKIVADYEEAFLSRTEYKN